MTLPRPLNQSEAYVMRVGASSGAAAGRQEVAVDQSVAEPSSGTQKFSSNNVVSLRLLSEADLAKATTRLGADTEFNGVYKSNKPNLGLVVAGDLTGQVRLGAGSVFVLEPGGVGRDVSVVATNVFINGHFDGEIDADNLEIGPGAVVRGAASYGAIVIHRGAKVDVTHSQKE